MIKTTNMLLDELSSYSNRKMNLSRMIKENKYIPIKSGLYETESGVSPYLLAGSIYGPHHISHSNSLSDTSILLFRRGYTQ